MRYGIPKLPAAPRVLDADVPRILDTGRHARAQRRSPRAAGGTWGGRRLRRRVPGRRRAHRQAGLPPGGRLGRHHPGRGLACCTGSRRRAAAARPPGRGLRRRQHRDGRGAHREKARRGGGRGGYRRTRDRMPATTSRWKRPRRKACTHAWLSTVTHVGEGKLVIERWSSTRPASPSRRVSSRSWRRTHWCSRSARTPTWPCSTACPARRRRGMVDVGPAVMTGPGVFAGGDMGPSERTVTVAIGHGKKAARNIDAGCAAAPRLEPAPAGRPGR